jgi:UDP-N-acetylmuramate dehydrogenase
VTATDADEIAQSVRDAAANGEPALLLGGGSNVVIADQGFPGTVILLRSRGVRAIASERSSEAGDAVGSTADDATAVTVRVEAGEPWDEVVSAAVAAGWSGLECLSGIPGGAGATPIQNVGAYGQEVAETITAVRVLDRRTDRIRSMGPAECGFGYRTSVFKRTGGGGGRAGESRWVVLSVDFRLRRSRYSAPVRYAELARALGVPVGGSAPLAVVREAVLGLRAGKGMVLDPTDPDTYSVGSFFTNPVLDAAAFRALRRRSAGVGEVASWPERDGRVKVSAAWLIERAGFGKGYGGPGVAISSKHTLALTNRGEGTTGALLDLAREIRDGVAARFGITLYPEPVLVGCAL